MNDCIIANGELYHYGIPGMRWGHRKATYNSDSVFSQRRNENWNQKSQSYKRTSIGRGQNPNLGRTKHDYRTGETAIGKNISKYAKDAINNRNSKNKTSSNNTKEAQKAKAKKVLKIGAAVAGTALAAYGAKKLHDVVRDKNFEIRLKQGEKEINSIKNHYLSDILTSRSSSETIRAERKYTEFVKETANTYANKARNDSFRTAFKNVAKDELSRMKSRRR